VECSQATVGFPRSLLFHKYHVLWSTFFEGLGVSTITSPPSNRAILERGIDLAVDETCLPLKVFLGHVDALRGKAEHILVPRVVTLTKQETACVKFWGAFDVARNSVPGVNLIEYNVDVANGITERAELCRLGARFSDSGRAVRRAYRDARAAHEAHGRALEREQVAALQGDGVKVLVVGHEYNLYDELLGVPLMRILREQGVSVVCSELANMRLARKLARRISTDIPWTYNKQLLGSVELYRERVDGIVYLVTFPCGPDSLMTELCIRRLPGTPAITIILDELQGEAGLKTRLESFVDLLKAAARAKAAS